MDFFEEGFDGGAFGFGDGAGTGRGLLGLGRSVGVVEVRFRGRCGHGAGGVRVQRGTRKRRDEVELFGDALVSREGREGAF
jgi:hypothetical protein